MVRMHTHLLHQAVTDRGWGIAQIQCSGQHAWVSCINWSLAVACCAGGNDDTHTPIHVQVA